MTASKPATADTPSSPLAAPPADALSLRTYMVYFGLAILGCTADLVSKELIFRWRGLPRPSNEWWIIEGFFGIETSVNRGALFGMGAGYSWVFASLSVVAMLGIFVWLFVFQAARDRWLNVALGMVTGGILGNLYDRLGLWDSTGLAPDFQHGVRDWILFRYQQYTWPNFNIADMLLVTGAIMLGLHAFFFREPSEEQSPADEKRSDQKPSSNDHRSSEKKATASS